MANNTKTTIELNGTLYDATTGQAVNAPVSQAAPTPQVIHPTHPPSAVNMDGFIPNKSGAVSIKKPTKRPATASKTLKALRTVKPAHTRPLQRAHTLMRHVVKKPVVAITEDTKQQPKESTPTVALPGAASEQRQHRAKTVSKSPSISRFSNKLSKKVGKTVDHLPVVQAPSEVSTPAHSFSTHTQAQASKIQTAKTQVASTSMPTVSFTAALAHATSHEQPKLKKPSLHQRTAKKLGTSSRVMSIGATSLAILLLVGFFAYQNVANIQMRLAATRAGFSASMPEAPSGFGLNGGIASAPGEVTVNFRSNSDDRTFQVTQKPSNWTSESLLSNHVAVNNQPYQTYEDKGKTIYIYNGSNATWVNGGVWYQINGNSSLNSDQLLRIANSF